MMAERRMFAKTVIDSDAFLDMPSTAQLLYFHLCMNADDEGFVNNPKSVMRNARCNEDDLKTLINKKFIIDFESGIIVIIHWKIHNYIAKDRFKETKYKVERAKLQLDENNSYTKCIHNVHGSDTQVRLGKVSIDKVSINNTSSEKTDDEETDSEKQKNLKFEAEFEKLWKNYPRKQGKRKAKQIYTDLRKANKVDFEEVKKGIENYADYVKKSGSDLKYIKHGSTFFEEESWNDTFEAEVKKDNFAAYDIEKFEKMLDERED